MKLPREEWLKRALAAAWRQGRDQAEARQSKRLRELQQALEQLQEASRAGDRQRPSSKARRSRRQTEPSAAQRRSCASELTGGQATLPADQQEASERQQPAEEATVQAMCCLYFRMQRSGTPVTAADMGTAKAYLLWALGHPAGDPVHTAFLDAAIEACSLSRIEAGAAASQASAQMMGQLVAGVMQRLAGSFAGSTCQESSQDSEALLANSAEVEEQVARGRALAERLLNALLLGPASGPCLFRAAGCQLELSIQRLLAAEPPESSGQVAALSVALLQACRAQLAGWELQLDCVSAGYAALMRAFELSRRLPGAHRGLAQQVNQLTSDLLLLVEELAAGRDDACCSAVLSSTADQP